jgi:hypothetical protein
MMGLSHVMSGTALGAALCLAPGVRDLDPASKAGLISMAGGFAVLPDLDHPNSGISRMWGNFSAGKKTKIGPRWYVLVPGLTHMVGAVSGGHRKGTHTIEGMLVFVALMWMASWSRLGTALALAFVTAITWLGVTVLMKWSPRRHAGENIGLTVLVGVLSWTQEWTMPWWVFVAMALGILAHIGGDMMAGKCPVSWRNTKKYVGLDWFTTGGLFEVLVMRPLILLPANVLLALYLLGFHPLEAAFHYIIERTIS